LNTTEEVREASRKAEHELKEFMEALRRKLLLGVGVGGGEEKDDMFGHLGEHLRSI